MIDNDAVASQTINTIKAGTVTELNEQKKILRSQDR